MTLIVFINLGQTYADSGSESITQDFTNTSIDTELHDINQQFRGWYHAHNQKIVSQLPLILLVKSSAIITIKSGQYQEYPIAMTEFNYFKTVLHAILGFYALVLNEAEDKNPDWEQLKQYANHLRQLLTILPQSNLASSDQELLTTLLQTLLKPLEWAIQQHTIHTETIDTMLFDQLRPQTLQLINNLGQRHAQNLRAVLIQIKNNATTQEWQSAIAVIMGGSTARRGNLETAVTAQFMGEDLLGKRIFYAENIRSSDQAVNFIQTLLGDSRLSSHLFHDPYRLWQDLFSNVSQEFYTEDFYTDLAE